MDHFFKRLLPRWPDRDSSDCAGNSGHKEYMFTTVDGSEIRRSPPGMVLKPCTRWWFQRFFCFHPYLGKIPILTNIFQMG